MDYKVHWATHFTVTAILVYLVLKPLFSSIVDVTGVLLYLLAFSVILCSYRDRKPRYQILFP